MRGLGKKNWGGFALAAVLSAGVAMVAIAQDAALEKRTSVMKSSGGHMKALNAAAKGEAPMSEDTVKAAEGVVANSKLTTALFKGGAPGKGSAAKAEIWSDWAGFEKAAKAYEDATPQLVPAAQSKDSAKLADAVKAVGATCGGCHKPYKLDKKVE
jgi:cytochrome c556